MNSIGCFLMFALDQSLRDAYKPITLLGWLKAPNFNVSRFSPPDNKITQCRLLGESANKLKKFQESSFEQINEELENLDRRSREQ